MNNITVVNFSSFLYVYKWKRLLKQPNAIFSQVDLDLASILFKQFNAFAILKLLYSYFTKIQILPNFFRLQLLNIWNLLNILLYFARSGKYYISEFLT